jgi:hypothetical protein
MKKNTLVCTFLLATIFAKAQSSSHVSYGKTRLYSHGLYGGITLPKYKYGPVVRDVYQGFKLGYQYNLFSDEKESRGHGYIVSLAYMQKGANNKQPAIANALESKNRLNALQFELAQAMGLNKNHKTVLVSLYGGLYGSYFINGQSDVSYINGTSISTAFKIGTKTTDDFKPIDFGLRLGLQVDIKKMFIRTDYEFGLIDLNPTGSTNKIKSRGIELLAGINLSKAKH